MILKKTIFSSLQFNNWDQAHATNSKTSLKQQTAKPS